MSVLNRWRILSTSSIVSSWKRPNGSTSLWWNFSFGAFIDVSRMLYTLLQKEVANIMAECWPTEADADWSVPTCRWIHHYLYIKRLVRGSTVIFISNVLSADPPLSLYQTSCRRIYHYLYIKRLVGWSTVIFISNVLLVMTTSSMWPASWVPLTCCFKLHPEMMLLKFIEAGSNGSSRCILTSLTITTCADIATICSMTVANSLKNADSAGHEPERQMTMMRLTSTPWM